MKCCEYGSRVRNHNTSFCSHLTLGPNKVEGLFLASFFPDWRNVMGTASRHPRVENLKSVLIFTREWLLTY